MFDRLNEVFFSPLGNEFCDYYYYWTIFLFIMLLFVLVTNVIMYVKGFTSLLNTIFSFIPFILYYLHYRILYSMCSKSL